MKSVAVFVLLGLAAVGPTERETSARLTGTTPALDLTRPVTVRPQGRVSNVCSVPRRAATDVAVERAAAPKSTVTAPVAPAPAPPAPVTDAATLAAATRLDTNGIPLVAVRVGSGGYPGSGFARAGSGCGGARQSGNYYRRGLFGLRR